MSATGRILAVTPNPAIDVTYTVARQLLGETVRVSDVRRRAGGKGVNVARVLRALGREVVTLQPLGGDAGRWIERELTAAGLPVLPCPISAETRTTVAVVDGILHPTLFAEPGPSLTQAEWAGLAAALSESVGPGDWVVIAGSFPPGSTPAHLDLLVQAAHARRARVVVDTSGPLLAAAAEAGVDVVKANEAEIADAAGLIGAAASGLPAPGDPETAPAALGDPEGALTALARRGASVMMSRGARGALLRTPDGGIHRRTAVPHVEGNPTGAGDAATAGLVAALADGHDPDTALAWASICGAAAVLSPVAGEISADSLPGLAARAGCAAPSLLPPSLPSSERSPS